MEEKEREEVVVENEIQNYSNIEQDVLDWDIFLSYLCVSGVGNKILVLHCILYTVYVYCIL